MHNVLISYYSNRTDNSFCLELYNGMEHPKIPTYEAPVKLMQTKMYY